ncbi:hypothetical protein CK203_023258 [Vitis vinifera]|uniref:Uncharacterized protein n=1 Tax=Vitis vinifera TaxID=29760 RepID=A0A438J1N0_VITVI|nr:hypothetical protein CK203_023258 [Vitis vinifera]
MPTKPKIEDRRIEPGGKSNPSSTVYSQPWWHGVGNNAISPAALGGSPSKSTSVEHLNSHITSNGFQLQANGRLDDGTTFNKGTQPTVALQSVAFDWRALVIFEYVKLGSLIIVDHLFAL